jgi:hypothetical protein
MKGEFMGKLKVRAFSGGDIKWVGYYDLKRRKNGEEFTINSEVEFSPFWMEAIGWTPKPVSATKKAAQREIVRQSATSPLDIRKELERREKTFKTKPVAEDPVPETVKEVNVDDKSHNAIEEVI